MKKKVMIVVGGTGGHIYPSIALAKELHKRIPGISLIFVGGELKQNPFFSHHDYLHATVDCAQVRSKNPLKLLKSFGKILKGIFQSRRVIKTFKPDLIVGFGSYHTFPTLLAAKFSRIPFILHEANSIPGKVNKLLSRHALATGIHFPEAADHLKGNTVEVGMPLREGYKRELVSKSNAKDFFGLKKNTITFLVFGGSQGAKKLNELVSNALCHHFHGKNDSIEVLHFLGEHDKKSQSKISRMYELAGISATVKEFENRMDLAWRAADCIISRAGAATIAEQLEFEVPGILIPYPFASEAHQDKNADFMVKTVGGALKFEESSLTAEKLGEHIFTFLNHDHILLKSMQEALSFYKEKQKKKELSDLVLSHIGDIK